MWKKGHGAPGDPACVQLPGSSWNPALLGLGRDFIAYLMLIDWGTPERPASFSTLVGCLQQNVSVAVICTVKGKF